MSTSWILPPWRSPVNDEKPPCRQQQRELQHTLVTFSTKTNKFQKKFQEDLASSIQHVERISKNLDSMVVKPSLIGTRAYEDLLVQERKEQHAWTSYKERATKLYDRKLGRLMDQKKKSILEGLSFGQLYDRESVIPEAHRRTFEWMAAPDTDQKFVEWLCQEKGTFWVTGKAGSGKSTLMKFLVDHTTTRMKLSAWAGGDLVIANHFF